MARAALCPSLLSARFSWYRCTPLCSSLVASRRSFTAGQTGQTIMSHESEGRVQPRNAWIGAKGPGSLDLRSDVVTTPTPSMLAAVASCSLLDDVFQEDPTTKELEAHVAALANKEAGLFVVSGTMGNQLALRSLLTQPPYAVACDHRAHIVTSEAGGVSSLTGATVQPIVPSNSIHLTLEDIVANVVLDDDVHGCPTRVISLENTLHGMVMPLDEIERISRYARQHSIAMHCDGARLWEACVATATSLADFCSHFDTISLCFSKGLGAPAGSMLVGSTATLKHARWVRKSIGGGMRQSGVLAAAARVAVADTFGTTSRGTDGLLRQSHDMAKRVEALWTGMGGVVAHPVHTNMCWLNLDAAGCTLDVFIRVCAEHGLKVSGGRLVTHYQIAQNGDDVLSRLKRVFTTLLPTSSA